MTRTTIDRLRPSTRSLFLLAVIAALVVAPALAAADEGCETLNEDVALVGVQGSPWFIEHAKGADLMVHESGEDPAQGLDTPS